MASAPLPLAIFASTDQNRANGVLQAFGSITSVAAQPPELAQSVQAVTGLQQQIDASNPIVLIVSSGSAATPLFQSIALYAQQTSKRLIIIDLDDAGETNIVGNLKNFGSSVICSSDPELDEILDTGDRWTLPDGQPYPETGIDYQKKC